MSQPDVRTFYELQPILPLSEWWQSLALAGCVVLLMAFVIWMYLRDSRDLPRALTVLLSSLRIIAIVGILVYILNPGKRSETRIVKTSRLAVLVDTSLSMGLRDPVPGQATSAGPRRIDNLIEWISSNDELQNLRRQHEISIYRFGEQSQPEPILSMAKTGEREDAAVPIDARMLATFTKQLRISKVIGWLALGLAGVALACLFGWLTARIAGRPLGFQSVLLSVAVYGFIIALIGFAGSDLQTPQFDLWTSLGWKAVDARSVPVAVSAPLDDRAQESQPDLDTVDWTTALNPQGTSTQLGSAIQYLVNHERGGPIAGIVVLTDGRSNAGVQPQRAIASAANAGVPVFPIGIGSIETPKNVLVADVQAPPRVLPSDNFQVKGIVKSFGLSGQMIRVQLVSVDEQETEAETLEAETQIRLLDDGQATPVEFSVSQQEEGKRRFIIRAEQVDGDLDPRDNQRAALVEIIKRETKVLLIAGGPNREFRFLRNQLYRDKDIILHVWLQSSKQGADQESDLLLQEFPESRDDIYYYDCIIAFDPDWRELSSNQTELLERWVAEQAGGLVVVAGPVNTPEWTRRPRGDEVIDKIRALYPVSFYSQGSAQLKLGRFGSDQPFPLSFTREGRAAEFLWLGDTSSDSQANWGRFEGVFGYYAVNEPKSGADILANFADPATVVDERLPIYLASQYYGAGRVFFQASSEMWRIRSLDVSEFQQYYTKLIRWVSQGRLLRDSTRGVLLTDRDRCWMGDQIEIQAILRDAQDQPLMWPSVPATIVLPDKTTLSVELQATQNAVRPGTFNGQFTAGSEGDYRVSLQIPDSPEFEVLTTTVEAKIPDLEKEQPQRNDALLSELAEKTNGHFYVGTKTFRSDANDPHSPDRLIQPQDQETFLTGTLDRFFQRKLMMWLLGLIATTLALEWTIRRLHKLA